VNTLEVAADLAANYGWPVFPCKADKRPATEHGFKDASTALGLIDTWFAHDALIGVPTGRATGLLVIDIDPRGADWYLANAERLACGCINRAMSTITSSRATAPQPPHF
jgi:Bifunctional DNA primase/polymerase, N-terminal